MNATVGYHNKTIYPHVNISIMNQERIGLIGLNGAGKTTTIEVLEGLLTPTSGSVQVLGRDWKTKADEIRERIGISLQETRLSDKLTVVETLRLFRSFYQTALTAEEAMAQVSLEAKADTWVKRLSGGQRQRLAVATALVGDPELIFLDEPTTGLDPIMSKKIISLISKIIKDSKKTAITITHDINLAMFLATKIILLDDGKVAWSGNPKQAILSKNKLLKIFLNG